MIIAVNFPIWANVWLHSSVGRASHRYRGGHGFESRWSPDFFFRLLLSSCSNWKINCDNHSSLSSTSAVQIWIISYILHVKVYFTTKIKKNDIKRVIGGMTLSPGLGQFSTFQHLFNKYKSVLKIIGALVITGCNLYFISINLP